MTGGVVALTTIATAIGFIINNRRKSFDSNELRRLAAAPPPRKSFDTNDLQLFYLF